MKNDGRLSPRSFSERMILGTEQAIDNAKSSLDKLTDPFSSSSSPESQRYKTEIDDLRKTYKDAMWLKLFGGKVITGTLGITQEITTGFQQSTAGTLQALGTAVQAPFSPLGTIEKQFNYKVSPTPQYEEFKDYLKGISSSLFQTTIGYGGKNNQNNWQTGIASTFPWAGRSIKNIGGNLLKLRPVKAANSLVESVYNAGSLITNTGVSTLGLLQNTTIGFGNALNNTFNSKKTDSEPATNQPKAPKQKLKNKREPVNPLAQLNNTPPGL